jgi:hypothetical protein
VLCAAALALACGSEARGPCTPEPPRGELGTLCGFENPEDLAWAPGAGLLLVSQMRHAGAGGSLAALALDAEGAPLAPPRRLWPPAPDAKAPATSPEPGAWRGEPGCTDPPAAESFAPHGLALAPPRADGALPVAAVSHAPREAVELFLLDGAGAAARLHWTGCAPLPAGAIGNDVVIDADGGLWVTNYQPAMGGLRGLYYSVAGGLGSATGEVLLFRMAGWSVVAGTRGANPNGLALAPDERTLAVAFTGARRVRLLPLASGEPREVLVEGHPDNLLWAASETLYAAVHTSGLRMLACRFGALPCRAPWRLVEIDAARGQARAVFAHDGARLGGVASLARVGERLFFGGVFDDRIGVLVP